MRTPLLIYTEYKPLQSIFDFLLCPFECSYPIYIFSSKIPSKFLLPSILVDVRCVADFRFLPFLMSFCLLIAISIELRPNLSIAYTATYFYGHSFNLDNNPPNISPFRLEWVAQRKSEVNGKNCY